MFCLSKTPSPGLINSMEYVCDMIGMRFFTVDHPPQTMPWLIHEAKTVWKPGAPSRHSPSHFVDA